MSQGCGQLHIGASQIVLFTKHISKANITDRIGWACQKHGEYEMHTEFWLQNLSEEASKT